MKVRLLTNGGFTSANDCVGKTFNAKKYKYGIVISAKELNKKGGTFEDENDKFYFTKYEYFTLEKSEYEEVENYIMLDGKKIEISDETAESIKKVIEKPKSNIVTKYPDECNIEGFINDKLAFGIYKKGYLPFMSNKEATIFLITDSGVWYDEDGNRISGFLSFEPNEE